MLGYFSLVGLLRLHSLLGDYHQALRVIDNMNVNRKVTYMYYRNSCPENVIIGCGSYVKCTLHHSVYLLLRCTKTR